MTQGPAMPQNTLKGTPPALSAAVRLLTALLLAALLLVGGCAAKKELPPQDVPVAAQAGTDDAPKSRTIVPETNTEPPAADAASPAPETEPGEQAAPAEAAPQAKADEQETPPAPKISPARQMLLNAGRNPDAPQPETGFHLSVPDSVGDGEAFFVEFAAEGAKQVRTEWRGMGLSLKQPDPRSGRFQALLPVALDEKSTSLPLTLRVQWADGKSEAFTADMPVARRKYPVQRLKVDSKFVSPPPEMQEKIKRDRAEIRAAVTKVSPVQYWSLPFKRPVPGEVTSLYGSRRVFNNVPKNPHKGVDFDAKAGDPILAVEDGVVVVASDHYFSGMITIIDHGLGVMSAYLHQSAFNVQVGQRVSRGDVIGFIGSTGRSTGPHLHFSLYVLGESLNAAPCLDM